MALSKEELNEIIASAKADANNPVRQHPEIVDIEDIIDTSDCEEIEHVCTDKCQHVNISPAVMRVLQMRAKRLDNLKKKKSRR